MAKSISSIINEAQNMVQSGGLGAVIRRTLIAGPLATVGYAIAYGIEALQELYTDPLASLGTASGDIVSAFGSGIELILTAGARGSADALGEYGIAAWITAILIIGGGIWVLGRIYDRMDIDFLTGIDVPVVSRYVGASDEEE